MKWRTEQLPSGLYLVEVNGEAELAEVSRLLAHLAQELASWVRPRSVVFDYSGLFNVNGRVRRAVTDWREQNAELAARMVHSRTYVVPSAALRGVLTALDWVRKHGARRVAYCSSLREALERAEGFEQARSD